MKNFTTEACNRVRRITGLSGEPLDFVTGTAVITAAIGKFPHKADLYTYIGMSERELDTMMDRATDEAWTDTDWSCDREVLRDWFRKVPITKKPKPKAMIYAVSSDLVLEGLVEDSGDADEECARELLKSFVRFPQMIQTGNLFDGLMVTLEFLRYKSRGLDLSLSSFLRMRYGGLRKSASLRLFCELLSENNPETFPDNNYSVVIQKLADLLDD